MEEIGQAAVPSGSCEPSSSLDVLVIGSNVISYVPLGNWESSATGVGVVNVSGSSVTNTITPTPNPVNSCASNPNTGVTVCVSNGTDVYLFSGSTLTKTLTDGGSSTISFSGGDCTTCSVAMDATHNQAILGVSINGVAGFQVLNLATDTFDTPVASPSGSISENPLVDPVRNLLLSAAENGDYEVADISNPVSPVFYENTSQPGEWDSAGEDCTTGIAIAGAEFSDPSQMFVSDLTQATFTPPSSPGTGGTWSAPTQTQSLTESSLSAGADGVAVAQGTDTGVVTGEFGGNAITALALPTTSGSGTPAIQDWVTCGIPNSPDGNTWSMGDDPHTVTAYKDPSTGDAMALFANYAANWVAKVDLTQLLNQSVVPRDSVGYACASGTIPASLVSFISVP
jgi:hypothetical protein